MDDPTNEPSLERAEPPKRTGFRLSSDGRQVAFLFENPVEYLVLSPKEADEVGRWLRKFAKKCRRTGA